MMLNAQRNALVTCHVSWYRASMLPCRPDRSLVIRRFKEDEKAEALRSVNFTAEELQQQLDAAVDTKQADTPAAATAARPSGGATRSPTDTNLSGQQLQEIKFKEAGNISPRMAEMRADLGTAATDLSQYQAFDGPIPETVNGRLAMLGVVLGLYVEMMTGTGLLEQTAQHPLRVLFIGLLIAFASYAPVVKGYTRKEPYANSFAGLPWTPLVENWNGRAAMLGFTGMILTEAITGVNTLQAWGLQPEGLVGYLPPAGLPVF